ncbi:hypothetical protein PanWU01x14_041520 [Parasponia andersonii]|uniref:Uncharacterized protein n=1 Tax=Parasponia andersonii TaxID=3476 RepID=A0A2P5DQG7_PARAD|nr:hypothetical protein PanWU01x14_041520 [Parasponia andersonii]
MLPFSVLGVPIKFNNGKDYRFTCKAIIALHRGIKYMEHPTKVKFCSPIINFSIIFTS